MIDIIDGELLVCFSSTITRSPSANTPVVCKRDLSLPLLETSATNPIAPLDNPLILEPTVILLTSDNFNIVNVCISYKCKSNSDAPALYVSSEAPNEYTLATPILIPLSVTMLGSWLLRLYRSILLVTSPPKLI